MEPQALILQARLRELEARVLDIETWLAPLRTATRARQWQLRTTDGHLLAVRPVASAGSRGLSIRILLDQCDLPGSDESHYATVTAEEARELAMALLGYSGLGTKVR